MGFRTIVDIPESPWKIEPMERMLFVGSCFADNIGKRFTDGRFRTAINQLISLHGRPQETAPAIMLFM